MKWKVNFVTLIGVVLLSSSAYGTENNATATTTPAATTTQKPIITQDSALCKRCSCIIDVLELDCRNKSMSTWFNDDEWNTLVNGTVAFTTIRLEHNNLTSIPVLKPLAVKNLYLSYNSIQKIENAAFHNLLNLTKLDLSHNNITTKLLRPEIFQGNYRKDAYEPLPNVIELNLGHNELHSLDSDVFEHLPKLETLVLASNQFHVIDHLAGEAIGNLPHLKTLDLSYMELDDLPDTLLHSPRDLETLILTGNLLDDIPDGMHLAINLKSLTFDENPMGNFEGENVFPVLPKLEYLSISDSNDLVKVGSGTFSNLANLKTLVLSNNPKLSYIDPKAFAKATVNPMIFDFPPIEEPVITQDSALCKRCSCIIDVLELDCRNKSMSTWFNDDEWNTLVNGTVAFTTIRLEHNNLTSIPVLKPLAVKNLYLSYNSIQKIENAAFHNLLNLTKLDLSHNNITTKLLRPEVFQGNYNIDSYEPLPNVIELNLGHNELHSLDSDVFEHLPKLETLVLASNQFHVIDHLAEEAIGNLVHLKTLDLSYMELDDLPDNLLHSPRDLETLILTGNLLDEVPDGMHLAVNLKSLTFDENPMGNFVDKNKFPKMPKLEYLSISDSNDLVKVDDGTFSNLPNLKTIVLSNNPKLSYIGPKAFAKATVNPMIFDFPPIEEIYLHNNNLTKLDHDLIGRWDNVKTIDLRQNPWNCECENSWLINTLMKQINETSPKLVHDVVCSTSSPWKSQTLLALNEGKKLLFCDDHSSPSGGGGILIGILIGLLVGIPITVGVLLAYRRGYLNGLLVRRAGGQSLYNRASFQDDFHI